MTTTTTEPTTAHPRGARAPSLTYDVRRNERQHRAAPVPDRLADGRRRLRHPGRPLPRPHVVTYDPRGAERSTKADPTTESTPDQHADDLHRIIAELGGGPVDLFASSGGAVNALALVARHPEDVRTLVAHEPPMAAVLPDREDALAAARAIHDTYQRSGWGAGMAHFIAVVSHQGPFTADDLPRSPRPTRQMFGMPTEDDGSRTDVMLGQNLITARTTSPTSTRCGALDTDRHRGRRGVGGRAGRPRRAWRRRAARARTPVVFPSDHGGFLGGEYGQPASPRPSPRSCARS